MNLKLVLQQLEKHHVEIIESKTAADGTRTIQFGAALPAFSSGFYRYGTLVLSADQDDVALEERDALKRRLGHECTNIFGDDPDFEGLEGIENESDEENGSHLTSLIPKRD